MKSLVKQQIVALLILIPLLLLELGLSVFGMIYGYRTMGLIVNLFYSFNGPACIMLMIYIGSYGKLSLSDSSYRDVANYLNLNKIGKDK